MPSTLLKMQPSNVRSAFVRFGSRTAGHRGRRGRAREPVGSSIVGQVRSLNRSPNKQDEGCKGVRWEFTFSVRNASRKSFELG